MADCGGDTPTCCVYKVTKSATLANIEGLELGCFSKDAAECIEEFDAVDPTPPEPPVPDLPTACTGADECGNDKCCVYQFEQAIAGQTILGMGLGCIAAEGSKYECVEEFEKVDPTPTPPEPVGPPEPPCSKVEDCGAGY
jgi:hypothetical protein